jgi:ketosteroid isomerase-like protein
MTSLIRLFVVLSLVASGVSPATGAQASTAGPAKPDPARSTPASRGSARHDALVQAVRDRETAFARSMADRDHAAFTSFLSAEAVFIGARPLHGRTEVAAAWKRFFEGSQAPFSWKPEVVEVLESGTLALTSGPVIGADGKQSGTFNSIWRLEKDGQWRVVFDKGCNC